MNISAHSLTDVMPTAARTSPRSALTRGESTFANVLAQHEPGRDAAEVMREAAEQLVSTVFVTPVLAALRDDSMASGPFAPGAAEKRFGPLLDQQLADRIVHGANFSLVDMIVQRYAPQQNVQGQLERTLA